ncbi:MAG: superoxide dismutase [Candidatus Azambacteria bacterium]|nr:superoxide dismutase [Candidatus Azambacteria bacterium]
MKHVLPQLPYAYNALEPYIDAETMKTHHGKHHQAYIDKLNAVLEKYPALADKKLEDLIKDLPSLPMEEGDRTALKNNGGGHLNHSFFWTVMGPEKQVDEMLLEEIKTTFGSQEEFKKEFSQASINHFASGWTWLVRLPAQAGDENGKLQVYSLPNQDSPLTLGHTPVFVLDLWEHAYYLKYQNRRAEYIENWWNVLKLL